MSLYNYCVAGQFTVLSACRLFDIACLNFVVLLMHRAQSPRLRVLTTQVGILLRDITSLQRFNLRPISKHASLALFRIIQTASLVQDLFDSSSGSGVGDNAAAAAEDEEEEEEEEEEEVEEESSGKEASSSSPLCSLLTAFCAASEVGAPKIAWMTDRQGLFASL